MAQQNDDVFNDTEKNTTATGRDLPDGDGTISDEDVNAIDDDRSGKPIGQDHSLENYEDSMPTGGVGAIQNSSDTSTDIVHFADDEKE